MTTNNDVAQTADVAGAPELKACPFCGNRTKRGPVKDYLQHKIDCYMLRNSDENWNTRATPADLTERARRAAETFVPSCLSRTCLIREIHLDTCSGCDEAKAKRRQLAGIIAAEFGGSGNQST